MKAEQLVAIDLTGDERRLLAAGLNEWLGPARCTEELARAMGFDGLADLYARCAELRGAIESGRELRRLDWCRVLLAVEIVFISDLLGSGHDFSITTGIQDAQALDGLRRLQVKILPEVTGVIGNAFGTVG